MPRWAGAPGAPASSCGRSPVATERSAVGTLPVAAARRGDRSRFEVVVRTLPALRGRRRKAEELGDNGFGGAQHRGDQRRQVEAALAGGAHDAGEDLLGVGAVAGAVEGGAGVAAEADR